MSRSLWTALHDRLHQTIRQRALFAPHQAILIAVSGGQDSLCLARILVDLQPKWNWKLAIAHCDHRWRPDSQATADHVAALAIAWNLPIYREVAESIPKSEAEARVWRYDVLSAIAQAEGYSAIATGHTASDRAETLLFNLIRGSGADGLQALGWKRLLGSTLGLVRPLLETTRTETGKFCQAAELPVWDDATNQDLRYARNRIRHEVLPYLETHFNPQTERHLAHTMELLSADVEHLEQQAAALREQAMGDRSLEAIGLNRRILGQASLALQRRAVRQFLQQTLQFSPNFAQVEKVVSLISAPNRTRTDPFLKRAIAEVDGDWIWINDLPRSPHS
ncbi:tRNA lysidine(34) synthetase TilS [Myxacorys almedinensis]|uniref:tRNA(Ile)-lysidine synthase n=1 Tax=Myxacorys almedinensis A TaxID=2690445 RepID=A0A8J7YZV0_9CYAN|nr:tRNA lysidine(34) synthetase TilS [Myxacorys almedinensis]NDJ17572.1 tRNA lysidine(34) synthetase TilS [Myxacorys almedinensis A]